MSKSNISIETAQPIRGFCLFLLGLFTLLALFDYQPKFSQYYCISSQFQTPGNRLGTLGVGYCFYSCRWLGLTAWLVPFYLLWCGIVLFLGRLHFLTKHNILCFLGCLASGSTFFAFAQTMKWLPANYEFYSAGLGGFLGNILFKKCFASFLGPIGSALILIPTTLILFFFSFPSLKKLLTFILSYVWYFCKNGACRLSFILKKETTKLHNLSIPSLHLKTKWVLFKAKLEAFYRKISKRKKVSPKDNLPVKSGLPVGGGVYSVSVAIDTGVAPQKTEMSVEIQPSTSAKPSVKKQQEDSEQKSEPIQILASEKLEISNKKLPSHAGDYQLPTLDLLKDPPPILNDASTEDYYETANDLVQKLAEFGVEVKVEAIQSGPVITRYEVTPARGVRVEKITNLDKNIALGLKALSVRIQAPVPGKGCVGIEIPNKKALPVCLREILASKAWEQSDAEIPIVLGKEVTGKPIVADLTKMPHLLIAGSTGSGKTVCINAIIASLLFRATPKDLRFIMVDPKIVEMKIYNDLPHMLIPVVTDPKRVPGALKWLIEEMERRYQLFANHGARNIATFNEKIKRMSEAELSEHHLQHLPYIVCIIDELADLMMVAPGDIETCIARLAQLARAAGIHLIIATQRPSVNVITGIIKANLPSRIAFKVASKVDSRTILDMGGADSLIGKGDMLFIPPGASQLIRAQGAWVSDDEINNLVEFLKCNGAPEFAEDVQQIIESDSEDENGDCFNSNEDEDPLLSQALEVLKSSDRISTSLLQRRLKIGYNRAARIMDTLDERGLVPKNLE